MPCDACGQEVDPLRAAGVLAFDDGYRFFCAPTCVDGYRQGLRRRPFAGAGSSAGGALTDESERTVSPNAPAPEEPSEEGPTRSAASTTRLRAQPEPELPGAIVRQKVRTLIAEDRAGDSNGRPDRTALEVRSERPRAQGAPSATGSEAPRSGAAPSSAVGHDRPQEAPLVSPDLRSGPRAGGAPWSSGPAAGSVQGRRRMDPFGSMLSRFVSAMKTGRLKSVDPRSETGDGTRPPAARPTVTGGAGRLSVAPRAGVEGTTALGERAVTEPGATSDSSRRREARAALRSPAVAARLSLFFALGSVLVSPWAQDARYLGIATGAIVLSALCSAAHAYPTRVTAGYWGWFVPPLGVILAALAAQRVVAAEGNLLSLFGAAFAALSVLGRSLLDGDGRRSISELVEALTEDFPPEATVVPRPGEPGNQAPRLLPASELRSGQEVAVSAGEIVPVDGVVRTGEAQVQPYPGSLLLGPARPGDPVMAGARVLYGRVVVIATRVGNDRILKRIQQMAESGSRESESLLPVAWRTFHRFAGLFALGLAALVALSWVGRSQEHALGAAAALLIATPALSWGRSLWTPLVTTAAYAASRGILYHSVAALHRAAKVASVAICPRGILTEGRPELLDVHVVGNERPDELVALVWAAEEQVAAEEPLAQAVARYARNRAVPGVEVRRAVHVPAQGVMAVGPRGQEVRVGSRRFLLDGGVGVGVADAAAVAAERAGQLSVFVALGGRVRGVLAFEDPLRPSARAAVHSLTQQGLDVALLTGEQRPVAECLAESVGLSHVKAELLPEERGQAVRSLRETGGPTAVVGLVGRDDSALREADLALALGGAGAVAGEHAIAFVGRELGDVDAAIWMARTARSEARKTLRVIALVYGAAAASAGFGLLSPGLAAACALVLEAWALALGGRLLGRFALRLPAETR